MVSFATLKRAESEAAMTELKQLLSWLKTYPGWAEEIIHTDYMDGTAGCVAIYPKGVEILSSQEDLLGNAAVKYRCRYILRRQVAGPESNEKNAQWMMDFQQWVQQQNEMGLTPRFGDVHIAESIQAEKGALKERSGNGLAVYEVTLTAQYVRTYTIN